MKRYFVKTNAFNCVIFADGSGKGYMFYEGLYDEPLTLEVAKGTDYSGIEDIDTVEELSTYFNRNENIIDFNLNDPAFEEVVEF